MQKNAHEVGFSNVMWMFLESYWQQNPNKRPSAGEVMRRWREFVENGDGDVRTNHLGDLGCFLGSTLDTDS